MACDQLLNNELYSLTNGSSRVTSTSTSDEADVTRRLELVTRVSYAYISPLIILFGVFGDVMTIFILNHPLLRRTAVLYHYLTMLALTDLLTQLSVLPMILWLLKLRLCSYPAAFYYAHVGFPLVNALMAASVWIVVFLTLSQYIAVCHPFRAEFLRSTKMGLYLTGVSYLASFLIYLPWSFKKSVYLLPKVEGKGQGEGGGWCYTACDDASISASGAYGAYEWCREAVSRFLPALLIAYLNLRIAATYRETRRERLSRVCQSQRQRLLSRSEREERRLMSLLLAIVSIFFLCTLPAAPLAILVRDKWARNVAFQAVRALINLLEFTKFALNFYLYCLINPDIRKLSVTILLCRETRRPAMVGSKNMTQLSSLVAKREGGVDSVASASARPSFCGGTSSSGAVQLAGRPSPRRASSGVDHLLVAGTGAVGRRSLLSPADGSPRAETAVFHFRKASSQSSRIGQWLAGQHQRQSMSNSPVLTTKYSSTGNCTILVDHVVVSKHRRQATDSDAASRLSFNSERDDYL